MTSALDELSADPDARGQAEIGKAKEDCRAEGRADLLFKLLQSKFGKVPNAVRERLERASAEDVFLWAERILIAGRFDGVFGLGPAPASTESARVAAAEHATSIKTARAEGRRSRVASSVVRERRRGAPRKSVKSPSCFTRWS